MKLLSCISLVLTLAVSLSVSAADFTQAEISQMHEMGVKIKLTSDKADDAPYVVPDTISASQLSKAETVDFSNLPLLSIPSWLSKLSETKHLDLTNTKLTSLVLGPVLKNMPKLETLSLAGNSRLFNKKSMTLNNLWPHASNLRVLNINTLFATAGQIGSLAPLKKLQQLNLSDNRLTRGFSALALDKLTNLQTLTISRGGLRHSPLRSLPANALRSLDLSYNSISMLSFVDLPELETLNIVGNQRIRIDKRFGEDFVMEALKDIKRDRGVVLPASLIYKFERLKVAALKPIYQKHSRQYRVHSNRTVTDRKTGLMWKQCSEGTSGEQCQLGEATKYDWQQALTLNDSRFAGYSDWRVPTTQELRSLVFCNNGTSAREAWDNSCSGDGKRGNYRRPTLNQFTFPNTIAYLYWSSTPYGNPSYHAWDVNFARGRNDTNDKSNYGYVRLVRAGN